MHTVFFFEFHKPELPKSALALSKHPCGVDTNRCGTSDTEKTGPVANKDLSTKTHVGMPHAEMIVEFFIVKLLKPLMLLIFSEMVVKCQSAAALEGS